MKYAKKIFSTAALLLLLSLPNAALLAQGTVQAESAPSSTTPESNATLTVDINIDVSNTSPAQLLGSFSGTLRWDPAVLNFASHSGVKAGFTGAVGTGNTATGQLTFTGANPAGAAGKSNVLTITFNAIGANGTTSALDLEFSAMTAALTFANLHAILSVIDGAITIGATRVEERAEASELPQAYALSQNHPNPFSRNRGVETEIGFALPKESRVHLAVFNLLGQRINTLIRGTVKAGHHTARWNGKDEHGRNVPSGFYIYRMEAEGMVYEKRMTLLK